MTDAVTTADQTFVTVAEITTNSVTVSDQTTLSVEDNTVIIVSDAAQGPPGPAGPAGSPGGQLIQRVAAQALGGHRVVLINSDGKADYASAATLAHGPRIIGMTTQASAQDALVNIQIYGEVTEPSWNWQLDKPVYLGIDGALTQAAPAQPASKFSIVIGFPIAATVLFVNPGIPITIS